MGTNIREGTCGWPRHCWAVPFSVICLFCYLPSHVFVQPLSFRLLISSQTTLEHLTLHRQHRPAGTWKLTVVNGRGERGEGWLRCHIRAWISPSHGWSHVRSTNSLSPLSPHSKFTPATLSTAKDSLRSETSQPNSSSPTWIMKHIATTCFP